ncbi:MAG: AbrB/MazE/SpoVT family DNA-binding domain-containing protein [Ignavibacteria bacterium]|nr:MAG: AbrB/MazE/SpoVT family DNA-binding domain-containing protein [Ignavibacteria bacterium]
MKGKIQKWGNSLGLRIPKTFAQEAKLSAGSMVDIRIDGDVLMVKSLSPTYNLDDMLSMISPKNMHSEVDFGRNVGGEIW